jgi:hypothetical protein
MHVNTGGTGAFCWVLQFAFLSKTALIHNVFGQKFFLYQEKIFSRDVYTEAVEE